MIFSNNYWFLSDFLLQIYEDALAFLLRTLNFIDKRGK